MIVLEPVSVMGPAQLLVPLRLSSAAGLAADPLPASKSGMAGKARPPCNCREAPEATETLDERPKAAALEMFTMPPLTDRALERVRALQEDRAAAALGYARRGPAIPAVPPELLSV